MFKKKNNITICTEVKNAIDIEEFTNEIKTYGVIENYISGDTIYVSFVTKLDTKNVAKLLKEKLYKAETSIHGSVIFFK